MLLIIGQTIKKLRKERNLTQEELAEQLNVTYQAVSKWENGTGMPDISQVIPLASVFGVSCDVLFGTFGTSDDEKARKIIEKAHSINSEKPAKCVWDELQNGISQYPNNIILLMASLEYGISLAYPENDCHDAKHGMEIYRECIRQANLVIEYGKNITDVLRAHMIMVLFHSAYGDSEKAWEHANKFPERPDLTRYNMAGYISHAEKNYPAEAYFIQTDFSYHLTAIFDNIILLGEAYRRMGKYGDALKMFFSVFALMELVFGEEEIMPPVQNTDSGDVYALTAKTYIDMGDKEKALSWLEKMVDYDAGVRSRLKDYMYGHGKTLFKTPFLRDVKYYFSYTRGHDKKMLLNKLNGAEFESLKNNDKFVALINRANEMTE